MKKIYYRNNLREIIQDIIDRGYDVNYAALIASNFIFEEDGSIQFADDFSVYSVLMNYFLKVPTEEGNHDNFKRILNQLSEVLKMSDVDKECLVYIIYKPEIKALEERYKNRKITPDIFKRQIMKFGDGDFSYEKMLENYIGLD
jgi:hypothetical protein